MSIFKEDSLDLVEFDSAQETVPTDSSLPAWANEAPEQEWEWKPLERMEASVQESFGTLWGAASAVADSVRLEKAGDWAANRAGELFEKAADRELVNTDFSEIENPLDAGKWVVETITSFVPDLGMMFLGGLGLGTGASRAVAKGYGKEVVETMLHKGFTKNLKNVAEEKGKGLTQDQLYKEAAKRTANDAGRILGVSGFEGLQGTGQAYLYDREERGEDASPLAAFGTGAAQTGIAMLNPLNRVLAGKMPKGKANAALLTVSEAAEETGQELISMAHEAGISPDVTIGSLLATEQGRMRLLESGMAGALLGGTFGGGLRAITSKTDPATETQKVVEDITSKPEESLDKVGISTEGDVKDPMAAPSPVEPVVTDPTGQSMTMAEAFAARKEGISQRYGEREEQAREAQRRQTMMKKSTEDVRDVAQVSPPEPFKPTSIPVGDQLAGSSVFSEETVVFEETAKADPTPENIEKAETAKVEEIKTQIKEAVVPVPTNLKERNEVTKSTESAKKEILDKKEELKEIPVEDVSDTPFETTKPVVKTEPIVVEEPKKKTDIAAIAKAKKQKTLEEAKKEEQAKVEKETKRKLDLQKKEEEAQKKIKEEAEKSLKKDEDNRGYTAKKYKIDGVELEGREKTTEDGTKLFVMKKGSQYFSFRQEEGKEREALGKAKSVGAAQDLAEGKSEYVEKKVGRPKRVASIEDIPEATATELLSKSDNSNTTLYEDLQVYAEKKIGNLGIEVDKAQIDEAITRGAVDYKEGSKATLKTYIKKKIDGAVLDWTKNKTETQEILDDKGIGTIEQTSKEQIDIVPTKITKEKKEVAPEETPSEVKTVTLSPEEQQAILDKQPVTKKQFPTLTPAQAAKLTDSQLWEYHEYLEEKHLPKEPKSFKTPEEAHDFMDKEKELREKHFGVFKNERKKRVRAEQEKQAAIDAKKTPEQLRAEYKEDMKAVLSFQSLEDEADSIATMFSIAEPDAKKALSDFDSAYPDKLSEAELEARTILVDSIVADNKLADEFKKKYPTGLELMDYAAESGRPVTSQLSKFLLSNPAVRKKLKGINVEKITTGSSKYKPGINTVFINTKTPDTAIHEVVHGITVNEMYNNSDLAKEVQGMLDILRMRLVKDGKISQADMDAISKAKGSQSFKDMGKDFSGNDSLAYASLNIEEFLAQAFSRPQVQEYLKSIRAEKNLNKKRNTLWRSLMNFVGKALGLSKKHTTLLDNVLSIVPEIAEVEVKKRKGGTVQEEAAPKEENWGKRAAEMRKPIQVKDTLIKGAKNLARDLMKSSSEVLRKIDPKLIGHLRRFEMRIVEDNVKARKRIKPFMDAYKGLSVDDKNLLDLTLMNNTEADIAKRNAILKANGMTESFKEVERLLNDIFERRKKLGLNQYGEKKGYFPRRIKDMDSLMKDLYSDPEFSVIQAELQKLESPEEREAAVRNMLNTGRMPAIALIKGVSGNKRTIKRVSSKWKRHYEDAPASLLGHIYENNELLSAHDMFVDSNARKKAVKRRKKAYGVLENDKSTQAAKERAAVEIQEIDSQLHDPDRQYEGLDQFLVKASPGLKAEDTRVAINVIRARLNQRGMHGPMASFRNIALMSALSSPTSAITQIGDLAFSIYKNGPTDTIKAMLGPKIISAKDLDLEHSMKEFQTEGSAKWLDKTLTLSGLKHMDMFGKNVSINASLNKAKRQTLEEFSRDWKHVFGGSVEQLHADIKAGKNNENTRFFVFNDLSNWQPISLSEMPQKYLEAGNGRIFYALKSYNIKAINNIYRESVHKWRTAKSNKERMEAARNTGKLVLLMTLAGATADELKDLLMGRSTESFSDNVHENLLKIAFMSRYTLDRGFTTNTTKDVLAGILVPPTNWVSDPLADLSNLIKEDEEATWKTMKSLPWGKAIHEWFSEEAETKEYQRIKEMIQEKINEGEKMNSVRKDMHRYNKWARGQEDARPLTYKGLMVAKRRYDKKNS